MDIVLGVGFKTFFIHDIRSFYVCSEYVYYGYGYDQLVGNL